MARKKTNKDIPAPPGGSRSMNKPLKDRLRVKNPGSKSKLPYQLSKADRMAAKAEERRLTGMRFSLTTGKVRSQYAEGVKNSSRAQPKGTPPRTAPGSGGQSARYNRLTGGLMKHGR